MDLRRALEASDLLSEKAASLRTPAAQDKSVAADFAAFAAVKTAGAEELWQLGKRPLAWGLGLGLPAVGAGHALISDAHAHGKDLIRDARNQALLTAAGVGGLQGLGRLLQGGQSPDAASVEQVPYYEQALPGQEQHRLAALVMVDDLLEDACDQLSGPAKTAALTTLAAHRVAAMRVVRAILK